METIYLLAGRLKPHVRGVMHKILIVGAGFSGACLARGLADKGFQTKVIDERFHVAGNCHSQLDDKTGIMVHTHGPHIFHTDNNRVWEFVQRFGSFQPYIHRVKAISQGRLYSLPLNLMTINQLLESALNPEEARAYVESVRSKSITEPRNFEEQALAFLGEKLYHKFFYGYSKKQWGLEPRELPAEILKRLPVRFNYDDNYFKHKYQGLPTDGYTRLVENVLDHPAIEVILGQPYVQAMNSDFDHVFYSGPIDRYFNFQDGRLPYRSLKFDWFIQTGDYQGCAVINYPDQDIHFTRIVEYKHFSYWGKYEKTICSRELPTECGINDIPYYPLRFASNNHLLARYQNLARLEEKITFIGRLGTFRYLDMEAAIGEALITADRYVEALGQGIKLPAFIV